MKNLYAVLIVIALVLLFISTRSFNALLVKNAGVKAKWEQIEGPLARRNDLIRDLVNVVKGSTMSEEKTFIELDMLRLQWINMSTVDEKIRVANAIDNAVSRLFKAAENYPDLKGNAVFVSVEKELSGVENRIEIEKIKYNEAVRDYNGKVRNFPSSIIANLFGYKLAGEYPDVQ